MKRRNWQIASIIFLILLGGGAAGCSLLSIPQDVAELVLATHTPEHSPTPTLPPTPTPTPTPIPAVRVKQGDEALLWGDFERARLEYQTAFDGSPERDIQAAALVGVGRADMLLGDCESAVRSFSTVADYYTQPSSLAQAYYFLGNCSSELGDHLQAAQAYDRYVAVRPGVLDSMMHELRGDELAAEGDWQAASAAYTSAVNAARNEDTSSLELKIGNLYAQHDDYENAIRRYMSVYDGTQNDYVKAQANLLAGQAYLAIGMPEQAYTRFLDSVNNFPKAYDSYSGLVALVEAGVEVDDLNRGLVDYYAGQWGVAAQAFDRYLFLYPSHDGTAHHYKALSLVNMAEYERALKEWTLLIQDHPEDRFFADAWEESAFTLWYYMGRNEQAANLLLDYVRLYSGSEKAADFLFQAARYLERSSNLDRAAETWERLIDEYPQAENSERGLFLAGVTHYRMQHYEKALIIFQRLLVLSSLPDAQAQALFWSGKTRMAMGDPQEAKHLWEEASRKDVTEYYSVRARQVLENELPFEDPQELVLEYDLEQERSAAVLWMRKTFTLSADTDLEGLGNLAGHLGLVRGDALWELGEYRGASAEFEKLREEVWTDPVNCFRLMNHLMERGFYRPAILLSRQILDLANFTDMTTLTAPAYFNHIRFGIYYRDITLEAAEKQALSPLFLLSVMRQESFFEGFAGSSAGARGVMQMLPATGAEAAGRLGFPANFQESDLYRPYVNIPLGSSYLKRMQTAFGGSPYKALAAYNAGPGLEAQGWNDIGGEDPDLYLEAVRYAETRTYIVQISEFFNIYRLLYEKKSD